MKSIISCLMVIMLSALSMTSTAQAQSNLCKSDYRKYCAGVFPGGGRIIKCLSKNISRLEPDCRVSIQGLLACSSDQKKYCNGVSPANWKLQKCMEKHVSDLTPSCAKTINYIKKARKG